MMSSPVPDHVPAAVWTLEFQPYMGLVGVWDNEAAAKGAAEKRIARGRPLMWHRGGDNTQCALYDEADPRHGPVFFVTMHGVRNEAEQADPLNDGSAARTEPVDDPVLADRIYRLLAHALHGGADDEADCPSCQALPDPFASGTEQVS